MHWYSIGSTLALAIALSLSSAKRIFSADTFASRALSTACFHARDAHMCAFARHVCMCARVHMSMCICACAYVHAHAHAHVRCGHVHWASAWTHVHDPSRLVESRSICLMHMHMHTSTQAHRYMSRLLEQLLYTCTCTHAHMRMNICVAFSGHALSAWPNQPC